jgi:phage/plasmid-associated DNA primase
VAFKDIDDILLDGQKEEDEQEKLNEQFEAGGNGHDTDNENDNKQKEEQEPEQNEEDDQRVVTIIEKITEDILCRFRFLTIEESREILIYDKGVYAKGGEVLIEKTAECLYGYDLANRHLAEIKGHIMRKTFHKREELDANVNIINIKNDLYNIETGEFKEHTPDYLSITQKPIMYDANARPKLFGKYLQQVLYPTEIRTAIEVMAYTLYKDNPYEIMVKLFGYGANGKSVFTGLLTALHGPQNVSNVPLSAMLKNRFALSDLENKYINIDNELSSATIHDTPF